MKTKNVSQDSCSSDLISLTFTLSFSFCRDNSGTCFRSHFCLTSILFLNFHTLGPDFIGHRTDSDVIESNVNILDLFLVLMEMQ